MQQLLEKLQALKVADRQIDGEIFETVGGPAWQAALQRAREPSGCPDDIAAKAARSYAPKFTSSVDDAVTLVPPGWAWFVQWIGEPFSEGNARVWIPSKRTKGLKEESFQLDAANPAIALCITSLQAQVSE